MKGLTGSRSLGGHGFLRRLSAKVKKEGWRDPEAEKGGAEQASDDDHGDGVQNFFSRLIRSQDERDHIHFYLAVRSIVFKLTKGDAPDTARMNARVQAMIKDALASDGVEEIFKMGEEQGREHELFDEDYLAKWIADPQTVKPGTAMPKLPLTDSERQELVTFLSGLK